MWSVCFHVFSRFFFFCFFFFILFLAFFFLLRQIENKLRDEMGPNQSAVTSSVLNSNRLLPHLALGGSPFPPRLLHVFFVLF